MIVVAGLGGGVVDGSIWVNGAGYIYPHEFGRGNGMTPFLAQFDLIC